MKLDLRMTLEIFEEALKQKESMICNSLFYSFSKFDMIFVCELTYTKFKLIASK